MSYPTAQAEGTDEPGAPNGAPHELQQPDAICQPPSLPQYSTSENNNEKSQTANNQPPNIQQPQTQQGARTNQYQNAVPLTSLQESPAPVDCPKCGAREVTRVEYHAGGTAHASAAILCVCCCLGCIPYLATFLKDVEHKCGHCDAMLARWHKSGRVEILAQSTRA